MNFISKNNKELVAELTTAFISSWNSNESVRPVDLNSAKSIFNTFKELIESMDEEEN